MPLASLKAYKPDVVQYVRDHLYLSRTMPENVASDLKEKGFYSNTTYLKDIEGSVRKIAALIEKEPK